jgi:hypothetical protein
MVVTMNQDTPSMDVVRAVADREGVAAVDLEPPLYSVVDTDALDAIVGDPGGKDIAVSFTYAGYAVQIADGDIRLRKDGV